jgi:hypothetical protein
MIKHETRSRWLGGVLALALGLSGCGAQARIGESLVDTVTAYNQGVRWGRFPAAAAHVPPEERAAFLDQRDELAEALRITDYELLEVEPAGGGARVHVKYVWFSTEEDVVRETHADQLWERRGKAWVIVDERRRRGPEMPGLLEPDLGGELDDGGDRGALAPAALVERR